MKKLNLQIILKYNGKTISLSKNEEMPEKEVNELFKNIEELRGEIKTKKKQKRKALVAEVV